MSRIVLSVAEIITEKYDDANVYSIRHRLMKKVQTVCMHSYTNGHINAYIRKQTVWVRSSVNALFDNSNNERALYGEFSLPKHFPMLRLHHVFYIK